MKKKLHTILALIISAVILISCQPNAVYTPNEISGDIQEILVHHPAEPTRTTSKVEQFPLPNCGGSDKLAQSLGTFASVSKSATVGAKATVTGGGEVAIPETAKLKLELQVELEYQQTFESANSRLDTIVMSAAAGTHVVYTIVWEEQTFNSIVKYSSDGNVYEVPYTYVLSVPKIDKSYNVICEGNSTENTTATQSVLYLSPVPLPTYTPYPTLVPSTAVPLIVIFPTSVPPTLTSQITTFITIFANQTWQDTGITINIGETLTIKYISGSWRWTGERADFDGKGDPSATGMYMEICTTKYDCPITDAPLEALVGKIGLNGVPFLIGNGITYIVPNDAENYQRLFLAGNDSLSGLRDNVGSIDVAITK